MIHVSGSINKTKKSFWLTAGLICAVCMFVFLLIPLPVKADPPKSGFKNKVDPVGASGNYTSVVYDMTNGLPTSEVIAITHTRDGFMWIGTYLGLIRYDGSHFERLDSAATGIGSATCLYEDGKKRLWIGTNDSGIALMEKGELHHWSEEDGLASDKICCIEESNNGDIYVGTVSGINIISSDFKLRFLDDDRVSDLSVTKILKGNDGLLYCLSNGNDFFTLRDGMIVDFYDHTNKSLKNITSFMVDKKNPGNCYFGTTDTKLYYGRPGSTIDEMEKIDIAPLTDVAEIKRIDDKIWVCATNGIGVLDGDGSFHHVSDIPLNSRINHVLEDYEGNLWFSSSRQGVMKLVWNRFLDLFAEKGLKSRVTNATFKYNGDLFIGTDTGLLIMNEEGSQPEYPVTRVKTAAGEKPGTGDLRELLGDSRIRSFTEDSRGRLWISVWRGLGLVCYDRGVVTVYNEADGFPTSQFRVVIETPDGSIVVACTGGLGLIRDDKVSAIYGRKEGLVNAQCLSLCNGKDGDILLGTDGGGIYIINETKDEIRNMGKKEGLKSEVVMRIKHDDARNIYWIITGNSIAYMTEDYQITTVTNFPVSNNLDLYENNKGQMWVLSGDGINIAKTQDLINNEEIPTVTYGILDGLFYMVTANSYSALTPEGNLYIAGSSGVIKANINASEPDLRNIKQMVSYIDGDKDRYYPDKDGNFTIPSKVKKLTIYAYIFNYALNDPHISYYLDGFDQDPVHMEQEDIRPVTYTNLRGGQYQFVMEMKDDLGGYSKKMAVTIRKEKALYEETWFFVLVGIFAVVVLAVVNHEINRRILRKAEEKHRRKLETERISNELKMASQIQAGMLPHKFPPFPGRHEFELYASMDPAREVGGDFYDFFFIDDDHLCLVIADVSDKGVPAALFMMSSMSTISSMTRVGRSPAEILQEVNAAIVENNAEKLFITVWMGIFEISSGKLTAANAGHLYPAVKPAGEKFRLYKDKHGLVIGLVKTAKYTDYEMILEPGSKFFVYTDGVNEAMNPSREQFGTDRMIDALNRDPEAPPQIILENVRQAVDDFTAGAEQFDDVTMLCFEYK